MFNKENKNKWNAVGNTFIVMLKKEIVKANKVNEDGLISSNEAQEVITLTDKWEGEVISKGPSADASVKFGDYVKLYPLVGGHSAIPLEEWSDEDYMYRTVAVSVGDILAVKNK